MDDLISRRAALSTIEKMYKMCEGNLSDYHDLLVACFTDLTPAQQWIPCSERLPEYGEAVLTYNRDGDYEINHIIDDADGEWFWDGVVAWMPLPEPWKGDAP